MGVYRSITNDLRNDAKALLKHKTIDASLGDMSSDFFTTRLQELISSDFNGEVFYLGKSSPFQGEEYHRFSIAPLLNEQAKHLLKRGDKE